MCLQPSDICNLLGPSVYCLRSILVICFFHTNNPTVQVEVWSDTLCLFCISTFCGAPLLSTATIFAYGRPFATLPPANQWHFTFVVADLSLFCSYFCSFVFLFFYLFVCLLFICFLVLLSCLPIWHCNVLLQLAFFAILMFAFVFSFSTLSFSPANHCLVTL